MQTLQKMQRLRILSKNNYASIHDLLKWNEYERPKSRGSKWNSSGWARPRQQSKWSAAWYSK